MSLFNQFVNAYVRQIGRNVANDHYNRQVSVQDAEKPRGEWRVKIPSLSTYLLLIFLLVFPFTNFFAAFYMLYMGIKQLFGENMVVWNYFDQVVYSTDRRFKSGTRIERIHTVKKEITILKENAIDKTSNPNAVKIYERHAKLFIVLPILIFSVLLVVANSVSEDYAKEKETEYEKFSKWNNLTYTLKCVDAWEETDIDEYGYNKYGEKVNVYTLECNYDYIYPYVDEKFLTNYALIKSNDSLFYCCESPIYGIDSHTFTFVVEEEPPLQIPYSEVENKVFIMFGDDIDYPKQHDFVTKSGSTDCYGGVYYIGDASLLNGVRKLTMYNPEARSDRPDKLSWEFN